MRRSPISGYGFAIGIVAIATAVRFLLRPELEFRGPFVMSFLAVATAGWFGGFGPALLATILSAVFTLYFFIPPEYSLAIPTSGDAVFLVIFMLAGAAIAVLSESMHRARERAESSAESARIESEMRKKLALELEESVKREQEGRLAVEAASRLKDEFLSTMSHELRTPLNSILGWSQILKIGHLTGDDAKGALESIDRSARQQAKLVDDLLDVSRIISGKLRLDVRPVDPVLLADEAIDSLKSAAAAKEIELKTDFESPGLTVLADESRFRQIVWHLVANAIKFTPNGGRVHVRLSRTNSRLEVSVSDSGEGIDSEVLPFIFDRFRQASSSTTRIHGGTGIGLAIVRHLVELHGGTVRVKSDGKDLGAVFTVELPLIDEVDMRDEN